MLEFKRCSKGMWDSTVPGIEFDQKGISNYAKMFTQLCETYPRGEKGQKDWESIVDKIKKDGEGKRYDCIIGVSGGTDSSYLLHIAKNIYGLRPLAVNLDNGWSSDIAVKNIKKVTESLNIDLETYVIDYEEIKDLLRAYMFAGLPWIDLPTDLAIKSIMFRVSRKEGIKYILRGNDFRSEGFQPQEWTYGDGKQLLHIHKLFGRTKLSTFPNYTIADVITNAFISKIKSYFPFYYLDYSKQEAQKFLIDNFGWEYYGGHHHENLFTKFAISYWLYEKFGIDKRIITLSAQVMSGAIGYNEAVEALNKKPYNSSKLDEELNFVLKKLDISKEEFSKLMLSKNKSYIDYPSYSPLLEKFAKPSMWFLKKVYPYKPISFFQMEMRGK